MGVQWMTSELIQASLKVSQQISKQTFGEKKELSSGNVLLDTVTLIIFLKFVRNALYALLLKIYYGNLLLLRYFFTFTSYPQHWSQRTTIFTDKINYKNS